MNYITTTDLRTKSKELIKTLEEGGTVNLVHRSKIVGQIKPKKKTKILTEADIRKLKKVISDLNLPKTTYKQREKIYRKHLEDKYGKDISGR